MTFSDREGPSVQKVPARTEHHCFGCKYFEDHMMIHRFIGPSDYEARCKHPSVAEPMLPGVNLGKYIGHHEGMAPETPDWCPFLQK